MHIVKFSLSGIDCGQDVSYGPYIGGVHLVELFSNDEQQCHVPLISRTTIKGKCQVTLDYWDANSRGDVTLSARMRYAENLTLTICPLDIDYDCVP